MSSKWVCLPATLYHLQLKTGPLGAAEMNVTQPWYAKGYRLVGERSTYTRRHSESHPGSCEHSCSRQIAQLHLQRASNRTPAREQRAPAQGGAEQQTHLLGHGTSEVLQHVQHLEDVKGTHHLDSLESSCLREEGAPGKREQGQAR